GRRRRELRAEGPGQNDRRPRGPAAPDSREGRGPDADHGGPLDAVRAPPNDPVATPGPPIGGFWHAVGTYPQVGILLVRDTFTRSADTTPAGSPWPCRWARV